jgi:hypothetical protein
VSVANRCQATHVKQHVCEWLEGSPLVDAPGLKPQLRGSFYQYVGSLLAQAASLVIYAANTETPPRD